MFLDILFNCLRLRAQAASPLNRLPSAPDNSASRLVDIFFYGLYQDVEILARYNVVPRHPRRATLSGYRLRLGNNGSLLRDASARTPGLVVALTHAEIDRLYPGAGLDFYQPEAVMLTLEDNSQHAALCYITLNPASVGENNPGYAARLRQVMQHWGLPTHHIH